MDILDFINSIPKAFESDNGLTSLTLHGSCSDDNWKEKSYVDYDIIFVYEDEKLSKGLERVKAFFESTEKYSSEPEILIYSLKSGPMHPLRQVTSGELINLNNVNLYFFHVSVFSESTYKGENPENSPSKLLINTWQQRKAIIGTELSELKSIHNLTINDVLDSKLGIRDCIKMLSTKKNGYWDYTESNDLIWCSDDFSDFDVYEFCTYSIKWAIYNSISALINYIPLNLKYNSYSDIFKKHILSHDKYLEFDKVVEFERNIQSYRKQYVESPLDFTIKYSEDVLLKSVIDILKDVEKNLSNIQAYEDKNLTLLYEGKEIPIFISTDMKLKLLKEISNIAPDKLFLIYDSNVRNEYDLSVWIDNIEIVEYIVGNSSKEKSLESLVQLLNYAEKSLITTSSLVVIVGGGNVGNLGGMASGLLLRGIPFIHLPTTVLAQLDSSIGAKQSVNGKLSKNRFGLFHNPKSIFINPLFNKTLNEMHIKSGLIESMKHGFCQSSNLIDAIIAFDVSSNNVVDLGELIFQTIKLKLEYMLTDPYENSPDQHLELGHKVGHSLEQLTNETIPHGICVAFGMVAEAYTFYSMNLIKKSFLDIIVNKIKLIVDRISTPFDITDVDIANGMIMDNKRRYDIIPFVLLSELQAPEPLKIEINEGFIINFTKGILFAREVFSND